MDERVIAPAFVTGGSGFLGRALLRRLRSDGIEARALARSERATREVEAAGAVAVRGDLQNADAMSAGMRGCHAVFHCAARVGDWGARDDFYRDTVEGTEHSLDAAKRAGVATFLHVSTEAVLVGGGPIVSATEARPLPDKPIGLYPWSKGLAEMRVLAAADDRLTCVIVRPRFIWGEGDTSLLPKIVAAVEDGRWRWIEGGRYLTSTCHVDNVVEGMLLAARRGRQRGLYFLTDGEPIETREFLSALCATRGVEPADRSIPRWLAHALATTLETAWRLLPMSSAPPLTRTALSLMGQEVTVSDELARREIGYRPIVTRAEGLAAMG
jgi:nucleoside-diphosphate-sugar epimerase